MATKGPSGRYDGTRGSNKKRDESKTISYPWAKDFNKYGANKHYNDHAKDMGLTTKEAYAAHALKFANTVDKVNCVSFVHAKTESTYKYNKVTNEFAIITKNGYVVTYYKPSGGYKYYKSQKAKYGKKGGKK
ncbi:MAG: hypothetical protein J5627_03495 [Bacilli bacterium]|nr:hypothetical protein [Bacilli bacterium]